MSATNNIEKVSPATVLMHCVLAACIFFIFVSSWWMLSLPLPSAVFTYRELPFQLHKNVGLTVLLLVVVMMIIRLRRNIHADSSVTSTAQSTMQKIASFDYLVIYFLLLACCITGYLSSSYSGWQTELWWLFTLPSWTTENDELNIFFSDMHIWSCWALLAVISLHISAAVFHAARNDGVVNKIFRL